MTTVTINANFSSAVEWQIAGINQNDNLSWQANLAHAISDVATKTKFMALCQQGLVIV